jgi:hypothetical protein
MGSALASMLVFALGLAEPGYVPVGGHDGVSVYMRKDSGTIELAAVGELAATPAEVQAVLLSYEEHPRIIKALAESTVLARAPGALVVYQHLKLPVVSDRDYTLRVTWTPGVPSGTAFRVVGDEGPRPMKKRVRMTVLEGRWDLTAIADNATRAVYHVKIDFGGSVPRGMVRGGAAKDLPNVFIGYRRLLAERRAHAPITASIR